MSSELLTQEELDALLDAVREGAVPTAPGEPGRSARLGEGRRVQPYDFRRPSRLSMEQTRTLQRLHEKVGEVMSASLSNYLGVGIEVALTSVQEFSYELMIDALPPMIYVTVLSLAPAPERGMLTFDMPLCLGLVDRLLGGDGKAQERRRPLTTIDQAICDNVVEVCLRNLRESWAEFQEMELRPLERKTDCRLLQLLPPSETVLAVCFQAGGEIESGEIRFVVPMQSLEKSLRLLTRDAAFFRTKGKGGEASRAHVAEAMQDVGLNLSAQVGSVEISIGEMLRLGVGDMVRLDRRSADPIELLVDGVPKFRVRPGLAGRQRAVQVLERITQ